MSVPVVEVSIVEQLDYAVSRASAIGLPVTGWHVQRMGSSFEHPNGGFAIWLYYDDGDTAGSLQDRVDVHETIHAAAAAVVEWADSLETASGPRGAIVGWGADGET